MLTRKQLAERRKSWKEHTKYSGESTLLVLPCNAGGPFGSYFKGSKGHNLWTHCAYYLKEWRNDLVFMATDNAACWMPGRVDGLGAGEFEWEVSRAESLWDAGVPTANRFDARRMKLFVENLQIICQRIKLYGFQRVFVILTPLAYRSAFMRAAELEKLPVVLFSAGRCGVANVAAQLLRCLFLIDYPVATSVVFTNSVLDKVPLPVPYKRWDMEDSTSRLPLRDLDASIVRIEGKYSKYFVWKQDLGDRFTDEELSGRYLVPAGEDFSIFRRRNGEKEQE